MTWNYQIVKTVKWLKGKKFIYYNIHEIYYNKEHEAHSMTLEPVKFGVTEHSEDIIDEDAQQEIIWQLEHALKDIREYPVFREPKVWAKVD